MRILFVVHQFFPEFQSGTERVTLELARSAQRDGHHVVILTSSQRDLSFWQLDDELGLRTTAFQGLKVVGLPPRPNDPLGDLGFEPDHHDRDMIEKFFDQCGPFDVAHLTHCLRMFQVVDAIRARRIVYVVTLTDYLLACHRINLVRIHSELCDGPNGGKNCALFCAIQGQEDLVYAQRLARMHEILLNAARITTCSQSVGRVFENAFPGLRIELIEHGIDLLAFGTRARGDPSECLTFGFLGTLTPVKGVDVLMQAFVKAELDETAHLEIVGPSFDPEYLSQLTQIAKLDPRITMRGPVSGDAVRETLGTFDVLCIPSIVPETFSLVMYEGFASGLPCVVSDLGHPASVISNHACGEVAKHGDVSSWADCLTRIGQDPDRIERYRKRLPVPSRIEEEGFRYSHIYQTLSSQRG